MYQKIDGTTIDDAEDLDLVMPVYNLTEYNSNYSETTGSLLFDDVKSLKFKAKLLGNTIDQLNPLPPSQANGILKIQQFCAIKILEIWRSLEMPLINCKIELKLKYKYCCVLSANGNDNDNDDPDNISFTVKDTKLYVPIVTLSAKDNQNLPKPLSKKFERSLLWK